MGKQLLSHQVKRGEDFWAGLSLLSLALGLGELAFIVLSHNSKDRLYNYIKPRDWLLRKLSKKPFNDYFEKQFSIFQHLALLIAFILLIKVRYRFLLRTTISFRSRASLPKAGWWWLVMRWDRLNMEARSLLGKLSDSGSDHIMIIMIIIICFIARCPMFS